MRRDASADGKALLELALLLPFLLVLALSAIELFQSYHNFQYMSVVAREVGNAAYRSCSLRNDDGDPPGSTSTSDCVQPLVDTVVNYVTAGQGMLPGVVVIVRVYRVNFAGGPPTVAQAPTLVGGYNVNGAGGKVTRYSNADIMALHSYIERKQAIITSEVFYDDPPTMPFFPGQLYETSVY